MSAEPTADTVWSLLTHTVMEHRDPWRRAVAERTGLPFSRIRVLKRLRAGAMTLSQLAAAAVVDKPAATVAVNDLVERGLVVRDTNPDNRRCKLVTLTEAGRTVLVQAAEIPDPAPPALTELSPAELRTLHDLLTRLQQ
ncbi:MarR family transcriptional regulator [Nocardia panacis]|uniref:MarR family transcriptional regulator n=1 Tax=Nocardia panacis TaxID=2340916 RepID=A0A3A4KKR4_9NOCA|nr:MarR family transcriptional regulator [Nocardia panacis]RJO73587.1 MarR family transcriptional regulator [Nocardia panacis]